MANNRSDNCAAEAELPSTETHQSSTVTAMPLTTNATIQRDEGVFSEVEIDALLLAKSSSTVLAVGGHASESAPHPVASTSSPPRRKRVRWSTVTVHEFGVGVGGSSISDRGGPSIGLAEKPEFTWTANVGDMAEQSEGIHRFSPEQRVKLLKGAGVSEGMISRYTREASIILKSRRRALADSMESSSEEETEDSEDDMYPRKRKAEAQHPVHMRHPQFSPMRRPRMIPANYV